MPASDVWTDIYSLQAITQSKEYQGYPTQKPVALLNRIIQASTNEGDVVLEPVLRMQDDNRTGGAFEAGVCRRGPFVVLREHRDEEPDGRLWL